MLKIKRALISVSDKTGLDSLVKTLNKFGVEILSTGGTRKAIEKLSIPVKDVSEYTGFPEMMDGRVKTLHPKIHGGLLALRNNKEHMSCAKKHDISMIDMVVINLYPFEKTIAKEGVKLEDAIENIDIGGPSMLRSAAKNYKSVAILSDPGKYQDVIAELEEQKGGLSEATLCSLALDVFKRTQEYDKAIYDYLGGIFSGSKSEKDSAFSNTLNFNFKKISDLRYGENPHQRAAFYKDSSSIDPGITGAKKLQGKELSFNNILDLTAALDAVRGFDEPAAVVIKHTNPCGAATADSIERAYLDALDCDRMSAFGSIIGLNRDVDEKLASLILEEADFVECLMAPSVSPRAQKVFSKKNS